ncbi:hypothetical protein [Glycomyces xiaoerkulensis]|uniref:hypothetical protein n=1 Tax=Glycomyces xiaoerkulensis TaxID=2038139 RepID=UPI0018E4825C
MTVISRSGSSSLLASAIRAAPRATTLLATGNGWTATSSPWTTAALRAAGISLVGLETSAHMASMRAAPALSTSMRPGSKSWPESGKSREASRWSLARTKRGETDQKSTRRGRASDTRIVPETIGSVKPPARSRSTSQS